MSTIQVFRKSRSRREFWWGMRATPGGIGVPDGPSMPGGPTPPGHGGGAPPGHGGGNPGHGKGKGKGGGDDGGAAPGGFGDCDQTGILAIGGGSSSTFTAQRAWQFNVGNEDVRVCGLRCQSETGGNETLRLWRVSDEELLASVEVAPLGLSTWAIGSITPIVLPANTNYRVSMRRSDGSTRTHRTILAVTYNTDFVSDGGGFTLDADTYPSGSAGTTRYGVDIVFAVPT